MLSESFFPQELTSDVPRITITGRRVIHVEQHHGLMAYQDDKVVFRTGSGALEVHGTEIRIKLYSPGEAMITGEFTGVMFGGDQ